jgi:cell division protein FtsZ
MGSAKASGENRAKEAIMGALDSPLLNDNKIEGAKNVLLLIVSGNDEITIDEIGEINEHIQDEAKSGVNIIMGVGDDDSLGDSIAVTVIATGFHKDQQSTIIQQEPKKVIHILGKDQKSTFDLTDSSEFVSRSEEVKYTLEDSNTRIVHTLEETDEVEEMELIPTSEIIKNMEVVYEEISYETSNDFIITSAVNEIEVVDHEVIKAEYKNQTTFVFDNPIVDTKKTEEISIEITNNVNDIEVVNPTEVTPVASEEKAIVFDLGDFSTEETQREETKKSIIATEKVESELEIVMKEKVVEKTTDSPEEQELSPMHLTISELKGRTEERKNKMNKFNYKFNNKLKPTNVDEIEKEPAYKRMGVELDNNTLLSSDTNQSKTALSVDENND